MGRHSRREIRRPLECRLVSDRKAQRVLGFDDDHYHIVIEGEPEVRTRIRFVPPDSWGNHEWDTMTAMPAVNSVFDVARAPAGISTLKEVGLPCAPADLWLSR